MKRVLYMVLAVAILLFVGIRLRPTWEKKYERGRNLLEAGKYEEAVAAFSAAKELDPIRAESYMGRGDAYWEMGEHAAGDSPSSLPEEAVRAYEKALTDYLQALDLDPTLTDCYRKAAEVNQKLGWITDAVALLQRGFEVTGEESLAVYAEELSPKDPQESGSGPEAEGDTSVPETDPKGPPQAEERPEENIENPEENGEENQDLDPEPKQAPAEEALYTGYLTGGGWDELLNGAYGPHDLAAEQTSVTSCLADLDGDEVQELLLNISFPEVLGPRGYETQTFLLDADPEKGTVALRQKAFYGGGTMGGDNLSIRYDTGEERPVLVLSGLARDGVYCAVSCLRVYGSDFTETVCDLESTVYYIGEGMFPEYEEQVARIREETDLCVEDPETMTLTCFRSDGAYVSGEEYETLSGRFVDASGYGYVMRAASLDSPLGVRAEG